MIDFFISQYKNTSALQIWAEFIAFSFGILSVYFAKRENIWVYPTGLLATTITVYLLYQAAYFGDMTMNVYYSIMSIYGWYRWIPNAQSPKLKISRTTKLEKYMGFGLFIATMIITYLVYVFF